MNHMPVLWGAGDPAQCLVHARRAFYQQSNILAFGGFWKMLWSNTKKLMNSLKVLFN